MEVLPKDHLQQTEIQVSVRVSAHKVLPVRTVPQQALRHVSLRLVEIMAFAQTTDQHLLVIALPLRTKEMRVKHQVLVH